MGAYFVTWSLSWHFTRFLQSNKYLILAEKHKRLNRSSRVVEIARICFPSHDLNRADSLIETDLSQLRREFRPFIFDRDSAPESSM